MSRKRWNIQNDGQEIQEPGIIVIQNGRIQGKKTKKTGRHKSPRLGEGNEAG